MHLYQVTGNIPFSSWMPRDVMKDFLGDRNLRLQLIMLVELVQNRLEGSFSMVVRLAS